MRHALWALLLLLVLAGCQSENDQRRELLRDLINAGGDNARAAAAAAVIERADADPFAARWAGLCFDYGYGVEADLAKARTHWTRAAAGGDTASQRMLDHDREVFGRNDWTRSSAFSTDAEAHTEFKERARKALEGLQETP